MKKDLKKKILNDESEAFIRIQRGHKELPRKSQTLLFLIFFLLTL